MSKHKNFNLVTKLNNTAGRSQIMHTKTNDSWWWKLVQRPSERKIVSIPWWHLGFLDLVGKIVHSTKQSSLGVFWKHLGQKLSFWLLLNTLKEIWCVEIFRCPSPPARDNEKFHHIKSPFVCSTITSAQFFGPRVCKTPLVIDCFVSWTIFPTGQENARHHPRCGITIPFRRPYLALFD